jgi:hypothetical protein
VVDGVTGQQRRHDVERFVEHLGPSAVVELLAERRQLGAAAVEAEPDAEHQPSA